MLESLRKRQSFLGELADRGSGSLRYVKRLRAAFEAVRNGFSPDRVITDPQMNCAFLERCRTFGLDSDPFTLNRSLLQLRKTGELPGLKSKRTIVPNQWRFAFASEIAGRAVCLRFGVSIDTMLLHPKLVKHFDSVARLLSPATSAFEARWCALNIRKRGLAEIDKGRRLMKRLRWSRPALLRDLHGVPEKPGVCELLEEDRLLLVCESGNLVESAESQQRILDMPFLEHDLWNPSSNSLSWRYSVVSTNGTPVPAIVSALVARYAPVFNIPRATHTSAA